MQIISHRGAKGHSSENTAESIVVAAKKNVRYIEFDIQHTKNKRIVVYHNTTTPTGKVINDTTYAAVVREVPSIIELATALKLCGTVPALIESKTAGTIARALPVLAKYPAAGIASFVADEILAARINAPTHTTYLLQHYHPFGIIEKAKTIDAHGIGINKNWLVLLPYYALKATKQGLQLYVYTVNSVFIANIIARIAPSAMLCTDFPETMVNLQKRGKHAHK